MGVRKLNTRKMKVRKPDARKPDAGLTDRPSQFCGVGSRIPVAFLTGGTDDIPADFGVQAVTGALLKGLFDEAVLTGVEGENSSSASGFQHGGQLAQKCVENLKFAVHVDAECLEDPGAGFFHGFLLFVPG